MSTTSAIGSTSTAATTSTASASGVMGREQFLTLLVTQLQHQDPLNPMEDKDFIAQLAQFSSLEQMMNMSESMEAMGKNSTSSQALALTGKWIEYQTASGDSVTGRVDSVSWADGTAKLMVGGSTVDLGSVVRVYPGVEALGQTKSSVQAVGLIGKEVSYLDDSTGQIVTGKVSGVSLSNGWPSLVIGDKTISMSDVLETQGSGSSDDTAALAKSMVGMRVDYLSGGQTLSGKVTKAALDGATWKLTVGSGLIGLQDVVKVYPAS
jgi:flagellar basal-body rod modification protein FlgD